MDGVADAMSPSQDPRLLSPEELAAFRRKHHYDPLDRQACYGCKLLGHIAALTKQLAERDAEIARLNIDGIRR